MPPTDSLPPDGSASPAPGLPIAELVSSGEEPPLPPNFEVIVRPGIKAAAPECAAKLPATGSEPAPALVAALGQFQELASKQDELKNLFESRLQADEVQSKALERLHDQLQDYKSNFIRQALLPLLKEIIFCFDFVADVLNQSDASPSAANAETLAKAFPHVKQMLLDILFKNDVEPYRSESEEFDRKTQQCIKTVPTDQESQDKKIASRGVIGFRLGEAIIRKEQVTVYKYSGAAPAAPTSEPVEG
jgi:molecular chaperone GrpE (heat shock protein)